MSLELGRWLAWNLPARVEAPSRARRTMCTEAVVENVPSAEKLSEQLPLQNAESRKDSKCLSHNR